MLTGKNKKIKEKETVYDHNITLRESNAYQYGNMITTYALLCFRFPQKFLIYYLELHHYIIQKSLTHMHTNSKNQYNQ